MKEYNVINRCLSILKSSRIDVMTKLRMENLLIGMKVLLLVDVEQDSEPDFAKLLALVNEVCTGNSPDGIRTLVDHVRKMQNSMVACLNLAA